MIFISPPHSIKEFSYRKKIHAVFICVVLTIIIGGVIAIVCQWENQKKSYDNISLRLVDDYKNEIEHALLYSEMKFNKLIQLLEKRQDVASLFSEEGSLRENLMAALGIIPAVSTVYIGDTESNFLRVPYGKKDTTLLPATRPWFIGPEDASGRIKYTAGYRDWDSGKRVFSLSRDIFRNNGYYAVIGMDLDLERLGVLYSKMKHTMPTNIYIINHLGALVLGDEQKWEQLPRSKLNFLDGMSGILSFDDIDQRFYYNKMRSPNWTVLMVVNGSVLSATLLYESIIPAVTLMTMLALLILCWWRSLETLKLFNFNLINRLQNNLTESIDDQVEKLIDLKSSELSEIENSANTDGLTGLYNRRAFDRDLKRALSLKDSEMSLAIVDIDNFKQINDTFGHLSGDDVLRVFASMAEGCLARTNTRVYRYGGEEFVIIFKDISFTKALQSLDDFRCAFAAREWRNGLPSITFSAGIKAWQSETSTELLKAVDTLLYQAKASGKNNVLGENLRHKDNVN